MSEKSVFYPPLTELGKNCTVDPVRQSIVSSTTQYIKTHFARKHGENG